MSEIELCSIQQSPRPTLRAAFAKLTYAERHLLTCALAGNHPDRYAHLRPEIIRALADVENPAFGLVGGLG